MIPLILAMKQSDLEGVNLVDALQLLHDIKSFLSSYRESNMIHNALNAKSIKSKFEDYANQMGVIKRHLGTEKLLGEKIESLKSLVERQFNYEVIQYIVTDCNVEVSSSLLVVRTCEHSHIESF